MNLTNILIILTTHSTLTHIILVFLLTVFNNHEIPPSLHNSIYNFLHVTVCCTSSCQLQFCTPDDGYGKYPKRVE
jgi:hypothetical protein